MRIGVRRRTWKPLKGRLWFPFRVRLSPPGVWARRRRRRPDPHETKNGEEKP